MSINLTLGFIHTSPGHGDEMCKTNKWCTEPAQRMQLQKQKDKVLSIGTCWHLIVLKTIRWVWDVTVSNATEEITLHFHFSMSPESFILLLQRVQGNPLASYLKWFLFGFNWKVGFTGKKICAHTDFFSQAVEDNINMPQAAFSHER